MFKIGDPVVWHTKWGSVYRGIVEARFTYVGIPSLFCRCTDPDFAERGFTFIADEESCRVYLAPDTAA